MTLLEDQAERAELKVLFSDVYVAEEIRIWKASPPQKFVGYPLYLLF